MKKNIGRLLAFALASTNMNGKQGARDKIMQNAADRISVQRARKSIIRKIERGHSIWEFGEKRVLALNRKNAFKKALRHGYITEEQFNVERLKGFKSG